MKRFLVGIFLLSLWIAKSANGQEADDIMFVGDINLGRLVAQEIARNKSSPWELILNEVPEAFLKIGNLEGTAGIAADCQPSVKYCLNFPPENLQYAKEAGFGILGHANNHASDLAENGLKETRKEVLQQNIALARLEDSPYFVTLNGRRYALIFVNRIHDAQHKRNDIPSARIAQAFHLARLGADFVIVYIHWGEELRNWASKSQRDDAQWLIHHGADMIVGSHPHVIEPVECIADRPVWFSLGNHIFDQKYPATHSGGLISCSGEQDLFCKGFRTQTKEGSATIGSITTAQELNTPEACKPSINPATLLNIGEYTVSLSDSYQDDKATFVNLHAKRQGRTFTLSQLPLLRMAPFKLPDGKTALFMLVNVYSDLDRTLGIRPHVYRLGEDGIKPLWRGSGLAYPLIDAIPIQNYEHDYICALHAGGSFLTGINPDMPKHVMTYRWNGFGFSAEREPQLLKKCETLFYSYLVN